MSELPQDGIIRLNEDGALDEVVADHCSVHLGRLGAGMWRLRIGLWDGAAITVGLSARGEVTATCEREVAPGSTPEERTGSLADLHEAMGDSLDDLDPEAFLRELREDEPWVVDGYDMRDEDTKARFRDAIEAADDEWLRSKHEGPLAGVTTVEDLAELLGDERPAGSRNLRRER